MLLMEKKTKFVNMTSDGLPDISYPYYCHQTLLLAEQRN